MFILVDNLGYGELGCYGGGALRGAPTPRIDKLAAEGMRFTNMNTEPQAVKWRNYKLHFYLQETMVSAPMKLGIPMLFDLYDNPQEDPAKPCIQSWVIGPILKMVGAFEESTKKYPLIPMGTPDPYLPQKERE